MNSRHAAVWTVVHHERAALVRTLETLGPEQWATPTACPGWDVHDVVAHLVDTAKTTRVRFVRDMITARFDFDRQNAVGLARERRTDPLDTLAALRAVVTRTSTPPAAIVTRLVEAFVHGEDIRRAVGLSGEYPVEQVAAALTFQLRTTAQLGGGKERASGLRLVSSDAAVDSGVGPEVRGTTLALLLAVSGRPVAPDELSGPGAATLIERAVSGR